MYGPVKNRFLAIDDAAIVLTEIIMHWQVSQLRAGLEGQTVAKRAGALQSMHVMLHAMLCDALKSVSKGLKLLISDALLDGEGWRLPSATLLCSRCCSSPLADVSCGHTLHTPADGIASIRNSFDEIYPLGLFFESKSSSLGCQCD